MKNDGLTANQLKEYNEKGYLAPIDILSSEEVKKIRVEIESIEKKWPDQINGLNRNNIHYYSPIFDQIVHNSKIVDVVENFIGHNILSARTVLFLKEPENKGFISWHQDGIYQGWKPYNSITAWLAITDVNEENGCMKMWPGSHKDNFKKHKDTFDEDNLLTRGQTIENVPAKDIIPIILKPGQLSIHHPMTVHGSGPNLSKSRRIGFAIQSYIGSNVEQILGKTYVQQVRGKDDFKYHEHTP
jgi:ectoine hydroxylase-related dioxygenase (phytanoyl-CoA dioxygenase family)